MKVFSKLKEEFFKILPPSFGHFWAIQIILFVLIAIYCTIHELARVIGKEKILRIFFGPMPAPQV